MIRKILFSLIGLLVFCIATLLIVPNFIDWNQYKGPLLTQIEQHSGLKVEISGPISCSFFPTPKLKAEGIKLKNAPGGKAEYLAQIKKLALSVKLFPLLRGKVHVSKIELIEPIIYLEKHKNGEGNWQQILKKPAAPEQEQQKPAAQTQPTTPTAPAKTGGFNLAVQNIAIEMGFLSYSDEATQKTTEIKDLNLSGSVDSLQGPFKLNADFDYSGYQFSGTIKTGTLRGFLPDAITAEIKINHGKTSFGVLTINGQQEDGKFQGQITSKALKLPLELAVGKKTIDLQKGLELFANIEAQDGQYKITSLKAVFDRLTLIGTGLYSTEQFSGNVRLMCGKSQITLVLKAPAVKDAYEGDLSLKATRQKDLLEWLGQPDIQKYIGDSWSISSHVKMSGPTTTLSNLQLRADKITCDGAVALNLSKKVPYINATVHFPRLDTAALVGAADTPKNAKTDNSPSQPKEGSAAQNKTSGERWSKERWDFGFMKAFDLDLKLAIDALHHQPYQLSNVRTVVEIKGGNLKQSKFSAQGYGGTISSTKSLNTQTNDLMLAFELKNINLKSFPAVKDTPLKQATLTASSDLQAKASSMHELINTLKGVGKFALTDGVVEAFDLKQFVADLKSIKDVSSLTNLQADFKRKKDVHFSHMRADFTFKNGYANTQNLELNADDGVITGKGTINLPGWQLDLQTLIKLNDLPKLPPLGLNITGSIDSPNFSIDRSQLTKVIMQGLANQVMDRVKKEVATQVGRNIDDNAKKVIDKVLPGIGGLFGN